MDDENQNQKHVKASAESAKLNQCFKDAEYKLSSVRVERNELDAKFGTVSSQWKDALAHLEKRHIELEATMADLQKLNEQLTQSNAMLLDLKYKADQAEAKAIACDYEKTKFLARMSHEIRSPLSIILGYAEQILEDDVDLEGCRQIATQVRGTGDFILEVVNEVLDISKIEAGAFTLAATDTHLVELIHEVHELFGQTATTRGISFHLDLTFPLPETIYIDGHRLKQVLVNLCNNAIKFTDKGSVTLRMKYVDSKVAIEVQDSGIGMTQEQLNRIFQPFTQAEDTISSRFGGTGLGLYIAHEIVGQMEGTLQVTSEVGKGSCFHIELPVGTSDLKLIDQSENLHSAQREVVKTQHLVGRAIVAEDTRDLQIIIGAVLKKAGLEVTLVNNGQQAVDAFKSESFDLVLLDVEMPVLDGVSAFRAMRQWEEEQQVPSVPIIALTAHAFKDEVRKLKDAGFNDIITKPFQRQEFLSLLGTWLAKSCS